MNGRNVLGQHIDSPNNYYNNEENWYHDIKVGSIKFPESDRTASEVVTYNLKDKVVNVN